MHEYNEKIEFSTLQNHYFHAACLIWEIVVSLSFKVPTNEKVLLSSRQAEREVNMVSSDKAQPSWKHALRAAWSYLVTVFLKRSL